MRPHLRHDDRSGPIDSMCREKPPATTTRRPIDFERQPLRSRFEAFALDAGAERAHKLLGPWKERVLPDLAGTILEIGAGTGANLRYYSPHSKVVALEPNPAMLRRLERNALSCGLDLEVITTRAEDVDLPDNSVDAIVGTLVLCGVTHPTLVVEQLHRILRPGGIYAFIEHVAAPARSTVRRLQTVANRPHRWLCNGCEVNRDTEATIRQVPFASVTIEELRTPPFPFPYIRDAIAGIAIK